MSKTDRPTDRTVETSANIPETQDKLNDHKIKVKKSQVDGTQNESNRRRASVDWSVESWEWQIESDKREMEDDVSRAWPFDRIWWQDLQGFMP